MSVRKLGKDEKFTPTVKIDGKKADVTFSCRTTKDGDAYAVSTILDFGNVSHEDIMGMAVKTAVIDLQRRFRTAYAKGGRAITAPDAYDTPIDVQKAIVETQPRTNPAANMKARLAAKDAELEALKAELAALKAPRKKAA